MKQLCLLMLMSFYFATGFAQDTATGTTKYVQVTTIESVIGAGAGRSKMLITKDDGTTEEKEMSNLFSLVGINFKNVKDNEVSILSTLKSYTDSGWKLISVAPLTLSPGSSGNGIFMTRYLLSKEEKK